MGEGCRRNDSPIQQSEQRTMPLEWIDGRKEPYPTTKHSKYNQESAGWFQMIVGNPPRFAIESGVAQAYASPSLLALGFFLVHVAGRCYGLRLPEATLLACSVEEVRNRIALRGKHTAPFATESRAEKVAHAFRYAIYASSGEDAQFFGMSQNEFSDIIYLNKLTWAPDGDKAFDDGSYIL